MEHNPDVVTLPQHFKNHGYTTVNISKIFDYRTVDKGMDTISWSRPYFPANDKDMLPFYSKETGPVAAYFYQSKKVSEFFKLVISRLKTKNFEGLDELINQANDIFRSRIRSNHLRGYRNHGCKQSRNWKRTMVHSRRFRISKLYRSPLWQH